MSMESEGQTATSQPPPIAPPPAGARPADHSLDVLCHVIAFAGLAIPFGHVLGPLIIWLMKRDTSPSVDAHGKESLNFQISLTIWLLLCVPLMFIFVGFIVAIVLAILAIVWVVLAALEASRGGFYRYPLTIRFFK
jgi:uncharacterized protein